MSTRYATATAAGAAFGGFLFGFDTSTMNAAIVGIRTSLALGAGAVGFVAAIALIGCAFGAWFSGPLTSRWGRTRIMLLAGATIGAGSLAVALTTHLVLLGAFRFATGLGIGAASAVVPGYIAEISPTTIRGRLGTFWQFAIVFGQFVGLLVGFLLTRWAGTEADPLPWGGTAWRWMFVAVALSAVVYTVIVPRLPSSPHDLLRAANEGEARALLARLGPDPVDEQIAVIQHAVAQTPSSTSLRELRGSRLGLQPIVWTGILLAAFQQLVGISVVKTYSNAIWQAVGFSAASAFTISMVTVLISIVSTIVAIALMDRVGRKTLLSTGAAVMVIALGGLAWSFSTATGSGQELSLSRGPGITALIAINVFAVAFGITWGPVMWLMLSELFDTHLRVTAVGVCTAVNWLTNWAVNRTFPVLAGAGLELAHSFYAIFAALAFLFALRVLPETRGRDLS
jgi:MFS transporter, SP family, sugar:H+ symporter